MVYCNCVVLSCFLLPCLFVYGLVLSYLILSCLVLSGIVLFFRLVLFFFHFVRHGLCTGYNESCSCTRQYIREFIVSLTLKPSPCTKPCFMIYAYSDARALWAHARVSDGEAYRCQHRILGVLRSARVPETCGCTKLAFPPSHSLRSKNRPRASFGPFSR